MGNDTRCTIEGCERKTVARGWCNQHYRRWKRQGDPLKTLYPNRMSGAHEERFWFKVDASGDCWEWMASVGNGGYGVFHIDSNTSMVAHRYAWELLVGMIPDNLVLDHLCRVPACVNPDHLEPVTQHENVLRGVSAIPGSHNYHAQKTHCPKGHKYDENNTYVNQRTNNRKCRTCHREDERNRREVRREDK